MAKTRSFALNRYRCVIAVLLVRAASASGTTPIPKLTDGQDGNSLDSGLWRVMTALAVLVVLVVVTHWIMRRKRGSGTMQMASGRAIQIIDRKVLGPRQSLLLIQVGTKRVLLHQGKGTIATLCVFNQEKEELPE